MPSPCPGNGVQAYRVCSCHVVQLNAFNMYPIYLNGRQAVAVGELWYGPLSFTHRINSIIIISNDIAMEFVIIVLFCDEYWILFFIFFFIFLPCFWIFLVFFWNTANVQREWIVFEKWKNRNTILYKQQHVLI